MEDEPSSYPAAAEPAAVRIPHSRLARLLPLVGFASSIALLQDEVANDRFPFAIVQALVWLIFGWTMWSTPIVEASQRGVRLKSLRWTPWSEVASVDRVPRDGPARLVPELVLRNGKRRSLEPLSDPQVEVIDQLWRRYS